jgi:GNAT superfamily N-acetyltransferase
VSASADPARVQSCLRGEVRLFGGCSAGARVVELPGVVAAVAPAVAERSLFNAVVYERGADLQAAWPTLDRLYADASVRAWTVWLHPEDAATSSKLAERGHKLDGRPVGMCARIADMSLLAEEKLEWSSEADFTSLGSINDASYTLGLPAFGAVLSASSSENVRTYVARAGHERRAVCCLAAHDEPDGTLGISAVATLPEARGQGLASRLLSVALREAKARGLTHTALVASTAGKSVYARLGYQDCGVRELWERRSP